MDGSPNEQALAALAEDAFRAFSNSPEEWPDLVQFNRSGYSDVNIRGIWSFSDRVEFFHVPFGTLDAGATDELPTSPESSGASD